jgi:hypothetical protein
MTIYLMGNANALRWNPRENAALNVCGHEITQVCGGFHKRQRSGKDLERVGLPRHALSTNVGRPERCKPHLSSEHIDSYDRFATLHLLPALAA